MMKEGGGGGILTTIHGKRMAPREREKREGGSTAATGSFSCECKKGADGKCVSESSYVVGWRGKKVVG